MYVPRFFFVRYYHLPSSFAYLRQISFTFIYFRDPKCTNYSILATVSALNLPSQSITSKISKNSLSSFQEISLPFHFIHFQSHNSNYYPSPCVFLFSSSRLPPLPPQSLPQRIFHDSSFILSCSHLFSHST